MRVPGTRRFAVLAVVVAVAAGCAGGGGGDDTTTDARPLGETSFKEVVRAAVQTETDYSAEPGFGLAVRVANGLDWVELALEKPFAEYRRAPERREEIVAELVREAEERLERGAAETPFAEARANVMPLLKPRFALRKAAERPAQRAFHANLVVIYAVQREDEFIVLTPADLARWGREVDEIHPLALANLARTTEELLCEEQLCGWASGDGYDATRMIVPKLRRDIVAEIGPAAYAVPMEHVFVAVPIKYAHRIEQRVLHDFTTAENPVSPKVFVERRGKLVPLES